MTELSDELLVAYVDGQLVREQTRAVDKVLDSPPDLVVSGINKGLNIGDDVTYSGTVAGALEAVDADAVHTQALRLDHGPHRRALVEHLDPVVVEHRQVRRRVRARGLDNLDAGVDDHLSVLVVRRRVDGRQDRQVHTERLVRQVPALGDLVGQVLRRRLRQRGDETQSTRIGNGGNEFRVSFDNDVKVIFANDGQSFTLFQGGGQMVARRIGE